MKEYIVKVDCAYTNGVQELIRCKDCKYWDADEHNCNIKIGWFFCDAEWFCADGERRDKNDG